MRLSLTKFLIIALAATTATFAHAQEVTLTYSGGGGDTQKAARRAWLDPAASIGLKFKEDTLVGIADVRAQVQAGSPAWDIVVLGAHDCVQGTKEGLFENLDYSLIKTDGFSKEVIGKDWIGSYLYSNLITWNTKVFGKEGPKNWAEVWDVKKFPGTRGIRNRPIASLEVALLADGVAPSALYPIDVDRAFKSLAKIKPDVGVWWASGAQQIQLLRDGETDVSVAWSTRVASAVKDGAPLASTFNQGLLVADCFAILKGTKHKEAANKAIAFFLDATQQAHLAKLVDMGPVNPAAYKAGILNDADMARMPSSPDRLAMQTVVNYAWWGENGAKMQERYDAFLAK